MGKQSSKPAAAPRRQRPTRAAERPAGGLGALDDLGAIATFVRVVEVRSYSAAARSLGTTTSALSKRVAKLEGTLGVRLLDRTTRHLATTEAGAAFYQRCTHVLEAVGEAERAATRLGGGARGTLRVSAPVIFGELHVAPLVPALLARHPELRIHLALSDRFVDLVDEGFDLALRVGRLADSSLAARRLGRVPAIVCASPAYLERRGVPREPADLLGHECLRYSLAGASREWRLRGANGKERAFATSGRCSINHGGAMREATIGGIGLAQLPLFLVADALRAGLLRSVLDEFRPADFGIYAVYAAGRAPAPKVRAAVDFFSEALPPRLSWPSASAPRPALGA
ncbi:MAG: LysR family transcriptional regulator [Polyangiaceae bacterium]|jgi:DNA-binding transcriptional LysR family regulator|nr:LysR family transcriptional regulator [Polyangiaceae bacterium]